MKYTLHCCFAVTLALVGADAVAVETEFAPVPILWGGSLVLVLLVFLFGMLRPWAAFLPCIVVLGPIWSFLDAVLDPALLDTMRNKFGSTYLWHKLFASLLPLVIAVLMFVVRSKRHRNVDA